MRRRKDGREGKKEGTRNGITKIWAQCNIQHTKNGNILLQEKGK
jgi:hypothetical protein